MTQIRFRLIVVVALTTLLASFAHCSYLTSTSVWDLQRQLSPVTLGAGAMYVSGTGIRISGTNTIAQAIFQGIDGPLQANNIVPSWNVDMPAGTGILIELRGTGGGLTTTPWYEIARQGSGAFPGSRYKSDSLGSVADDTLVLKAKRPRIEYRVTLYTNTIGVTPTLRLMALCYSDTGTVLSNPVMAGPGVTTSLAVPWWSQYWSTLDPDVICGPTSMSMSMAYNGCKLPTETVAAETYDSYNSMYGNWPFICQTAARHGFKSYYMRSNSQQTLRDFIAQGVPVEIGMAYGKNQLTNSPIASTAGHLLLCVGITANGDYICNDPAGSDSRWDHVVYLKSDVSNVWLAKGGTTIPCIPNSVYWRFPYFPYKSSDPASINKDGKLELFVKGGNGSIYRLSQTAPNGGWSSWANMGGMAASDPVAVTNSTGGNTVFARFTDNNLYCNRQNGSSGSWSGWVNLGGSLAGKPAVGKSPDGRLDVFCRMIDGSIQHRWEDYSGGWQSWESLAGNFAHDPVIGLNWDGRQEIFIRTSDNQLAHKWQLNDGSWSSWWAMGGTLDGDPVIGRTYDGRLEAYCRFTDGTVRRNYQNGTTVGTGWSGWSSLGVTTSQDVALGRKPDFKEHLFTTDESGLITRRYQTANDGAFSSAESLFGSATSAPIVSHLENGNLQLFTLRPDGSVWGRTQSASGWSGWTDMAFPDAAPPVIHSVDVEPAVVTPGETVYITVYATDASDVSMVTANGTQLGFAGGGLWMGAITASNELGEHGIAIHAVDVPGNASSSSGSYTVKRLFALNNRAANDSIIGLVSSKYLFAAYGKVSVVNGQQFTIDDGSGMPITVQAPYHGLSGGEYVRVRGTLTRSGSETIMQSSGEYILPLGGLQEH
ncbi:MAG: C39 family peptidase [Armatimonadota bacterium]